MDKLCTALLASVKDMVKTQRHLPGIEKKIILTAWKKLLHVVVKPSFKTGNDKAFRKAVLMDKSYNWIDNSIGSCSNTDYKNRNEDRNMNCERHLARDIKRDQIIRNCEHPKLSSERDSQVKFRFRLPLY